MGLNGATKILNMNNKIINASDPDGENDAVNHQTMNRKILREIEVNNLLESQKYLRLDGENQIVAPLQMNANKPVGLADATVKNKFV